MQHLINLSLYEIRRDEYQQEMARINANGWKSVRGRTARETVAKTLITLAARIAPTVGMPNPSAHALAK
jgi:hypothetical protein